MRLREGPRERGRLGGRGAWRDEEARKRMRRKEGGRGRGRRMEGGRQGE